MSTPSCKIRPKSALSLSSPSSKVPKPLKFISSKPSISPSKKTPSNALNSPIKRYATSVTEKSSRINRNSCHSNSPDKKIEYLFPTHLEVIKRIRKIKNLSNPMPFSPDFPPPKMRIIYVAYSSVNEALVNKIKARKDYVDFFIPQEPEFMDIFLKRLKETERIIRQEDGFQKKVRKIKPKIQLVAKEKDGKTEDCQKRIKKRGFYKSPRSVLRTGIIAQFCYEE
ncbi:hypothetical protein SteCoe_13803 [Stentor coeruleus]|uniref:Uncharacterized protein n=1 Tax=Stentor coeruleus TaxID=5963 RepID=A0A1R2C7N0_9CILI|nr:hypothetical protein SteCoe_13803 [Stentor coeruleus]